jgi:penicillin-binding protein 1A
MQTVARNRRQDRAPAGPQARSFQRTRRVRRGTTWGERIRLFFGYVTLLLLLAILAGMAGAGWLLYRTRKTLTSVDLLTDYRPGGGITEVYATDADPRTNKPVLLGQIYTRRKEFAPINQIPAVMKDATIAIEDERFYDHVGVDFWGIGRALYRDLLTRRMSEGASTLTQQITRNIILKNQKKTLARKLQEAMVSIQVEKNFSKEQILEMYLNEACYGNNTYGVKAAANLYFHKPLGKLTLSEAALLAGLPQRPSAYDPFDHLDAAITRRDRVLAKMAELKKAKPEEVARAREEKIKIAPKPDPLDVNFKAPYFTHYVIRELISELDERYGKGKGTDMVYSDGLKIYTTLNWEMQREAERALLNGVMNAKGQGVTEGALVSVEPKTGYIRAMVGGVDYKKDQFNNVTQGRRQPGSTFKAVVYTAAFETGRFDPEYRVSNERITFPDGWSPRNYDGKYGGEMSIRDAVKWSVNIPAVRITRMTGPDKVIAAAKRMGVASPLARNLSIALGASAVSPLEMASVFSTFPNKGNHAKPMAIIRVVDSEGVVVEDNNPDVTKAAIPESVAADVSSMLRAVVTEGTGRSVEDVPDAHGKTGTTNERRDIWFDGYTPELSTVVWACGKKTVMKGKGKGKGKHAIVIYPPLDEGSFGGKICGPIWARFMNAAVPIQRHYNDANRTVPEKTVPSAAVIAAPVGLKKVPSPRPSPEEAQESATQGDESSSPSGRSRAPSAADVPTAAPTEGASATHADINVGSPASSPPPDASPIPEPTPRPRRTPKAVGVAADEDRLVHVTLCPDSGLLATKWCPETVSRLVPSSRAPRRHCRLHKPLPGDG